MPNTKLFPSTRSQVKRSRSIFCLATILSFLGTPTVVSCQSEHQGENSLHLIRKDYEVGFNYKPDPVVTARIACSAYHWTVIVDWGDGTPPEAMSHPVPERHKRTDPGVYDLSTAHHYLKSGVYRAELQLLIDCTGRGSKPVAHESYSVEVFDHIPLRAFTASTVKIRRGSSFDLTVELTAPAPPSGIRLFLKQDSKGVFRAGALPSHIDVQPNSQHTTVGVSVLPAAPVGSAKLTLIASNGLYNLVVDIE